MSEQLINDNEVLQGETSPGSERPEENTTTKSGLKKNRPRHSGAARRRYNKRQQEERAGLVQTPLPATETLPTGGGGSAGAGASKRARPEHNTPSPSEHRQGKKPKVIHDQGSYAQATKGLIRMALVLEGYPDKKLGTGEIGEVRRLVRGRILALPDDAPAPAFTGSWERDGAIIFCCANQSSAEWLKSLSGEKLGEVPLRALPADELPKRHRVVVHVEEPDLTVEETIKFLDRQNTGLAAREWVVIRGSASRDAKSAHFAALVGDASLEALKTCGWRPFCGLGRATIRRLDKERREETGRPIQETKETV